MTKEKRARLFLAVLYILCAAMIVPAAIDFVVCLMTGHSVPMPPATVGVRLGRSHSLTYLSPQVAFLHDVLMRIMSVSLGITLAFIAVLGIILMVRKARAQAPQ